MVAVAQKYYVDINDISLQHSDPNGKMHEHSFFQFRSSNI